MIKRSEINFAPYNPKNHSKENIEQIKRNIKRVAFLGGIIWNEVTGNLIDGHKRLMVLDVLEGYDGSTETDYDVKVEKISLDEKTEKEQNVFQTTSRTALDNELLAGLINEIEIENAGLSEADIEMIEIEVPNFSFANNKPENNILPTSKSKSQEERKQAIKDAKRNQEKPGEAPNYVTITFNDFEAKAFFMERFGFDHYQEFIKGERFLEKIDEQ